MYFLPTFLLSPLIFLNNNPLLTRFFRNFIFPSGEEWKKLYYLLSILVGAIKVKSINQLTFPISGGREYQNLLLLWFSTSTLINAAALYPCRGFGGHFEKVESKIYDQKNDLVKIIFHLHEIEHTVIQFIP